MFLNSQPTMCHNDLTLSLVHKALDELDQPESRLTSVIRKALRIARLRNDWQALYWLQFEMVPYADKQARRRAVGEVVAYFSQDSFVKLHERTLEDSIASRALAIIDATGNIDNDKLTALSVPELDEAIAGNARAITAAVPPNLDPFDAANFHQRQNDLKRHADLHDGQLRRVLTRIAQRVHDYLSVVERQLVLGQLQSDVFEDNRRYVDERLRDLAPEVLGRLQAAYRRSRDGTDEARSHALTSCRRALKGIADTLYPSCTTSVLGSDGKLRVLNDAMFVARLRQFIGESNAGGAAKTILGGDLDQLGTKIERLNELSSKGVHAQVTDFEVNMAMLGTYSVVGALLRLHDQESAATLDPAGLRETRQ